MIFCQGEIDSADDGCVDLVVDVEATPDWQIQRMTLVRYPYGNLTAWSYSLARIAPMRISRADRPSLVRIAQGQAAAERWTTQPPVEHPGAIELRISRGVLGGTISLFGPPSISTLGGRARLLDAQEVDWRNPLGATAGATLGGLIGWLAFRGRRATGPRPRLLGVCRARLLTGERPQGGTHGDSYAPGGSAPVAGVNACGRRLAGTVTRRR